MKYKACEAYKSNENKNMSMFGPLSFRYVFLIYSYFSILQIV